MNRPIAIISALPQELDLLASAATHISVGDMAGLPARRGTLDGQDVVFAEAGVGKVNAAVTAALVVVEHRPRSLVLTGVAGGLDPTLRIGDVVVADRVIQHDVGVIKDGRLLRYQPGHVPFFNPTDELGYQPDPAVLERVMETLDGLELAPVSDGLRGRRNRPSIVTGTVLTGDQFLNDEAVRAELHVELGAAAIEMEGGALAQAAQRLGVPHLVVRALSDLAGAESSIDFATFLGEVAGNSALVVRRILPVL